MTRKKRARKQKAYDDQFLRYVLALAKNASAGKKPRLTKYQVTGLQQRLHRLVLDRLPLAEIKRRIAHFNTLSFERMTYKDIENAVAGVVFADAVDSEKIAVLSWITDYRNSGLLLYRARKDTIPLKLASDCWSPPPEKARPSRLNREGEPLLYTSADGPKVVIDEIGAKPGEAVSIIVYSIRERLKLMVLGSTKQYPYLNEAQRQKQAHLFAFLSSQFVRTVPQGAEHLYRISQVIARKHWGIYEDHHGWLYPSIKSGTYHNVALEPGKAQEMLCLEGVICATVLQRSAQERGMYFHFFAKPQDDGSLRAEAFSATHKHLIPKGELITAGDELEKAHEYVRSLGPGSWQHLYETEVRRIRAEGPAAARSERR